MHVDPVFECEICRNDRVVVQQVHVPIASAGHLERRSEFREGLAIFGRTPEDSRRRGSETCHDHRLSRRRDRDGGLTAGFGHDQGVVCEGSDLRRRLERQAARRSRGRRPERDETLVSARPCVRLRDHPIVAGVGIFHRDRLGGPSRGRCARHLPGHALGILGHGPSTKVQIQVVRGVGPGDDDRQDALVGSIEVGRDVDGQVEGVAGGCLDARSDTQRRGGCAHADVGSVIDQRCRRGAHGSGRRVGRSDRKERNGCQGDHDERQDPQRGCPAPRAFHRLILVRYLHRRSCLSASRVDRALQRPRPRSRRRPRASAPQR